MFAGHALQHMLQGPFCQVCNLVMEKSCINRINHRLKANLQCYDSERQLHFGILNFESHISGDKPHCVVTYKTEETSVLRKHPERT